MLPKVNCRDYQAGDWIVMKELWVATGIDAPCRGDSAEMIERTLAQGGRLLVLEPEGGGPLAGSAWLTQDGRRVYLHHFAIRPDLQGQGLGRRLLAEALEAVRGTGLQVKLEVHRDNVRAQRLYRRHGFEAVDQLDVLMLRDLGVDRSGPAGFLPPLHPDTHGHPGED